MSVIRDEEIKEFIKQARALEPSVARGICAKLTTAEIVSLRRAIQESNLETLEVLRQPHY